MAPMNPDQPEPVGSMADIMSIAQAIEERLHRDLATFEMPGARLYGITCADRNLGSETSCFLAQHPDVYALLESPTSSLARMFDAAAVVTTGWAAPLGPDGHVEGAPSEHRDRRRVRLTVVVANHGTASVLRFADSPDEPISDPGSASGSLAEAIHQFWFGTCDPALN